MLVCDRCGQPEGCCRHSTRPDYYLESDTEYRQTRRLLETLGFILAIFITAWLATILLGAF